MLPDDVTGEELDADARAELRTLPRDLAARVARHLVMAGRLAEDDPELSYKHARAARRVASRVGIVREAAGLAAYAAGEWAEALAELRAARRLGSGDDSYLPVMADCERGLDRPERALDLAKSPEAAKLDQEGLVELRIVESGARRDLGQLDAAVVTLQIPELRDRRLRPWSARLFYAYADALAEADRKIEASDWFARAAAADRDGETDAAERYAELEGLEILDTEEGEEPEEGAPGEAAEAVEIESDALVEGEDGALVEVATDTAVEVEAGEPADADGAGDAETGDAGEAAPVDPVAFAFRPAEPVDVEAPAAAAPEAPAVFLEPAGQDAESKDAGDAGDEDDAGEDGAEGKPSAE
ncbi:hypothetical protein [Actinomadura parmotrematis]|uniref:hypothetical protein n=1 Tax=Actinomadura parmotrematis TaxID=2864039 RepID=UPI0027E2D8FE|nr:hypothetical protein [Actinomadura parmotrematis]